VRRRIVGAHRGSSGHDHCCAADDDDRSQESMPAELQGTWFVSTATAADPVRLYLRESSYLVSRGGSHSGDVEAEGDVLTFTSVCGGSNVEGTGRYRWTLEGDTLHLDLIGNDECGGRSAVLEDATYERRG
jgi:hypothetical protein